jgi:hypothetical protein
MSVSSPSRRLSTAPAGTARSHGWASVAREVAGDRVDRAVFVLSALIVGFGYSLLLPYAYTQRISTANWHYLDGRYLAFSVAFAVGLGWLIALQVHAVRRLARDSSQVAGRTGPLGALSALISVLPSLLCCSPILPTLIGLLGLSAGARLSTTVQLQHFFATKENLLLFGALGLVLASDLWSMHKLARASCLAGECCPAAAAQAQSESSDQAPEDRRSPRPAGIAARAEGPQR